MSAEGTGAWPTPEPHSPRRRTPGAGRSVLPVVEPAATPAEQHLGDRLAALVDGELSHDMRERVLAHLATCDECRAEADEQRRTKTVFAAAAAVAPAPPASLLARLQGLPGGDQGGGSNPFRGGADDLAVIAGQAGPLDGPVLPPAERAGSGPSTGFRIHDFSRAARPSGHRGRRFAFAAAGAFSMAAVAFGVLPVDDVAPVRRSDEQGSAVTPAVARPGSGGALSTAAQDDPIMMKNARQTLVAVHQPMRLRPQGPVLPPSNPAPGAPPSLLRAPGEEAADR